MSSHHPARHCFTTIDFSGAPIVVIGNFTEGEIYWYDFTLYPAELIDFMANPTGTWFNHNVRHSPIPFSRH
jgi:hypothetical protein